LLINKVVLSRSKKTGNYHVAKHNIETHSHNHFCREKALIITYYECVSVAFFCPACSAHRLYYIIICGLSG